MSAKRTQAKRGRGRPRVRDGRARPPSLTEMFHTRCQDLLERIKRKDQYDIFLEPVDTNVVQDYDTIVKTPMAISIIEKKLQEQQYKSLGEFRRDLDLIWTNCLLFNGNEPTNVFSKKAIELQKVTDKLIGSTRLELEKDKDDLNRWKERHRRNKPPTSESAQADAAQDALLSTTIEAPESTGPSAQVGDRPSPAAATRTDPRAAFELVLREHLRAQYASNTGLHKRSHEETVPDHYTTPDGTTVRIPPVTHDPFMQNRWDVMPDIKSRPEVVMSSALFNKIPSPSKRNVCNPMERREFINVKAYVDSMQSFVKDAGEAPTRIISEFLGPELILRETMEKRKRRKLQSGAAAPSDSVEPSYPKVKDPLSGACRLSMLDKPPKPAPELDGEDALHNFMSPELVEQVKNVPISVIDFAMPFGVRPESLDEILSWAQHPSGLRLDPAHVKSLEEIRKATTDFAVRQDPRAIAAMGGASNLNPSQLHDFQMKLTQQVQGLTKIMPDKVPIQQQRSQNVQTDPGRPQLVNPPLPPIVPTAARVQLNNEHQNPLTARRLQDQNAKSRSRARNSIASFQTRNMSPLQQQPRDPSANGIQGRTGTAAALANVLGNSAPINPLANLAPLQNTRHAPGMTQNVPPHLMAGVAAKSRGMGMIGGGVNNHFLGASATGQRFKTPMMQGGHMAQNPQQQLGGLPNITSAQNGITPAMHGALMNPSNSAPGHMRSLPNHMGMQGSNAAARLASVGLNMNQQPLRPPNEQARAQKAGQQEANIDSLGKQSSVLSGLLADDTLQRQITGQAQAKNVGNFGQNRPAASSAAAPTQQAVTAEMNGNLPRNVQAIQSRPQNSQPHPNHFNAASAHQAIDAIGYGPNAQQAGMTAARANSTELTQSATAPFQPQAQGGPAGPVQPQGRPPAMSMPHVDAQLFGTNEHGGSNNMAEISNLFDGREGKQANGAGESGTADNQLDGIFSFDGAALGDGNQPDFGF